MSWAVQRSYHAFAIFPAADLENAKGDHFEGTFRKLHIYITLNRGMWGMWIGN